MWNLVTVVVMTAVLGATSLAQSGWLTQNVDNTFVDATWACQSSGVGLVNHYYRVYSLEDNGLQHLAVDVHSVRIGVLEAVGPATGVVVARLRIWRQVTGYWPPSVGSMAAGFDLLADVPIEGGVLLGAAPGLATIPVGPISLPPGSTFIVEVVDQAEAGTGFNFKMGMNSMGETAPGWRYAPHVGCTGSTTFFPQIIQWECACLRSVIIDVGYTVASALCPTGACLSLADPAAAVYPGGTASLLFQSPAPNSPCYVFADTVLGALPLQVGTTVTMTQIAYSPNIVVLADPTGTHGPSPSVSMTNALGAWGLTFDVPLDPALVGLTFHAEGYVIAPFAPLPPNGLFWQSNLTSVTVQVPPSPTLGTVNPPAPWPGANVVVTGSGFDPALTLDVGGISVVPLLVTPTQILYVQPALTTCSAVLTVTNPIAAPVSLTLDLNPNITSVAPPTGPAAGGHNVIVFGGPFLPGTLVTFGGVPATVQGNSGSVITVSAPPGIVGPVAVVATSPSGCTAQSTYTYY